MKTLIKAILDYNGVNEEQANQTVEFCVREKVHGVAVVRCYSSPLFYIKDGRRTLGKGRTEDEAWENAAIKMLELDYQK